MYQTLIQARVQSQNCSIPTNIVVVVVVVITGSSPLSPHFLLLIFLRDEHQPLKCIEPLQAVAPSAGIRGN